MRSDNNSESISLPFIENIAADTGAIQKARTSPRKTRKEIDLEMMNEPCTLNSYCLKVSFLSGLSDMLLYSSGFPSLPDSGIFFGLKPVRSVYPNHER